MTAFEEEENINIEKLRKEQESMLAAIDSRFLDDEPFSEDEYQKLLRHIGNNKYDFSGYVSYRETYEHQKERVQRTLSDGKTVEGIRYYERSSEWAGYHDEEVEARENIEVYRIAEPAIPEGVEPENPKDIKGADAAYILQLKKDDRYEGYLPRLFESFIIKNYAGIGGWVLLERINCNGR